MALRTILEFPDPRLRTRAQPVTEFDPGLGTLIDDLFETMYVAPGIGLAATQVDVHKRVIVIDISKDRTGQLALVNPEILSREGEDDMEEGCLSFPKVYGTIRRAVKVKARYRDLDWNEKTVDLDGFVARILQHELDHLNGIVFIDRMSPADLAKNKPRLDEMKKAAKALRA